MATIELRNGSHSDEVMARINRVAGPIFDFVDLNVVVDKELSISELRKIVIRNAESSDKRHTVILISADQMAGLEEKLRAVLNHRDVSHLLAAGQSMVFAAVSVGGGGIGDVRRLYDVLTDSDGAFVGLQASARAIKIVERPEKNLFNTDIELLEETLPALTRRWPEHFTLIEGVSPGMRRQQLTLVQRLEFIENFRSFVQVLDDIGHELCSPVLLLEVLAQASAALKVLHDQGMAHRDFKADAVVLGWRQDLLSRARLALADALPSGAQKLKTSLLCRALQARIYDYDTVARAGGLKDPTRTTSSSENARIENPRELERVFVESDQYPLGIAALRLLPDLWAEVKSVMSSGMAVAVPMKIMMVRGALAERRAHYVEVYADFYGVSSDVAGRLIDVILRLIAFEPEDRYSDMGALYAELRSIQGSMPSETLLSLVRTHSHLFDDVDELIDTLTPAEVSAARRPAAPARPGGPRSWAPILVGLTVGIAVFAIATLLREPVAPSPTPAPVPTAPVTQRAEIVTPPPVPVEVVAALRPRLDLATLDLEAITSLSEMAPGKTHELSLRTLEGIPCALIVSRGDGERSGQFSYVLDVGGQRTSYGPTSTPSQTIREVILSQAFINRCESSSQARVASFIQRMPAEPALGASPISDQFTLCSGGDAVVIEVSVARESRLNFVLGLAGRAEVSQAPRRDLCLRLNSKSEAATGLPIFEDCSNLRLKFPQVQAAAQPSEGVSEPEVQAAPLSWSNMDIDGSEQEVLGAAESIVKLDPNSGVRMRIRNVDTTVEIIKLQDKLLYNGEDISRKSTTLRSALLRAINGTIEAGGHP